VTSTKRARPGTGRGNRLVNNLYFIGTSGWHYDHWKSKFYPEGLRKAQWLDFYAQHFKTVELNNSFYRLPSEDAFLNWRESSPSAFVFAVKASRFITHLRRLRKAESALENFLARSRFLGPKLGPILYQLPGNMPRNDAVLDSFLSLLPQDLKHAFEFRHPSWLNEEVFSILRRYKVGLCGFDMPDFSCPLVATADFLYLRFHGSSGLYSSLYSLEELQGWARRISELTASLKAAYIYFNNDFNAYAIDNARTLRRLLEA
jgi:uncharacterized protein YecE (DUF72 family)